MSGFMLIAIAFVLAIERTSCHMHDKSRVEDKDHLKEHLNGVVDLDNVSDKELQFHYFKVHDVEGNNKLDGCELVQSLLHFHVEESASYGHHGQTTKIFSDTELAMMIDPILATDDKNFDGFIDYAEFVAGQKHRGF